MNWNPIAKEITINIYNVLKEQDCLYTLNIQHLDGTTHSEVKGSLSDMLLAPDALQKVVATPSHIYRLGLISKLLPFQREGPRISQFGSSQRLLASNSK